jgi:hypothetical protein
LTPLIPLLVALSFAAGLNVYLTVLVVGLVGRFGSAPVPPELLILEQPWLLILCGVLFCAGFIADKIPYLDVAWNVAHTAVRIPLAALMAYRATEHLSIAQQLLVTALCGLVAAIAHSAKLSARTAVSASPEPVSNALLSTAEDAVTAGLSWIALHHPVAAACGTAGLVLGCVAVVVVLARAVRRAAASWRRDGRFAALAARYHRLHLGGRGGAEL